MDYSDNDSDGLNDILEPEDLFNDEADEDNQIEKQDYDNDRVKDGKAENEDAVEKKIKPKRIVKNPRVTLNFDTLKGPNGLSALKNLFKNFKFKGNNHEQEDLTKIMEILQQWMCYQLCPSYEFESCILQLEALGKKKVVQTHMKKFRMGMDDWGENNDLPENDMEISEDVNKRKDEFDLLLESVPNVDSDDELYQDQNAHFEKEGNQSSHISTHNQTEFTLTPEQLERIARNKKMAEERRLKRLGIQPEPMETEVTSVCDSELSVEQINLDENS